MNDHKSSEKFVGDQYGGVEERPLGRMPADYPPPPAPPVPGNKPSMDQYQRSPDGFGGSFYEPEGFEEALVAGGIPSGLARDYTPGGRMPRYG